MKKVLQIIFVGLFVCIGGFSQQLEKAKMSIGLLKNNDVYFNPKVFNPAMIKDSTIFMISGGVNFDGYDNSFEGFFISTESDVEKIKSGFSITQTNTYGGFLDKRNVIFSYRYKYLINKISCVKFGVNMGYAQYKCDIRVFNTATGDSLISDYLNDWETTPIFSVGGVYDIKNHSFGFAYHNYDLFIFKNSDISVDSKGVIANYSFDYKLSRNFSLNPEVYGSIQNDEECAIFSIKASYKNAFTLGLLYNTKVTTGFLVDFFLFDKLGLSYYVNAIKANDDNRYYYHSFNTRLIF